MPPPPPTTNPPDGLRSQADAVTAAEERELLAVLDGLELRAIVMHGRAARRTARHYGLDYDYEQRGRLTPGEPLPTWLLPVRERCAGLAGLDAGDLVEGLVQCYPPGATIGWHRDAPAFGVVVGLSLASASRMRFQRGTGDERRVFELLLEPRSAYVAGRFGAVGMAAQHPADARARYSITFRTLKS